MNAVIINSRKEVVASVNTELKSGASVRYSDQICEEKINASREYNLVNAREGKISRAKKYMSSEEAAEYYAREINPEEFFI